MFSVMCSLAFGFYCLAQDYSARFVKFVKFVFMQLISLCLCVSDTLSQSACVVTGVSTQATMLAEGLQKALDMV